MHYTATPDNWDDNSSPTTALVLVGPPGAGKTTVARLLSDLGVTTIDVGHGPHVRDDIETRLAELMDDTDQLCCFDGVTNEQTVGAIIESVDDFLIIRVDVSDDQERRRRYVEQELERLSNENEAISTDEFAEVHERLDSREDDESPYPQHHLTLLNDDDVETTELIVRLDELTSALVSDE